MIGFSGTSFPRRKQVEREVLEGEARFRAIAERLYDAILLVGADGRVVYASPSMTRILGRPVEDSVGRNVFERMHAEDAQAVVAGFTKILKQPGGILEIRCRFQHQDGTWRWLEGTARNWLNEPGVRAIVGAYRDVTDRHRDEERLKQAYDILEQRVAERTVQLSAANELLKEHIAERRRAESVLQERNRELKILNTITIAISRSLHLDVILATLQQLLKDEVNVTAGCIYVYDPAEEGFSQRVQWGLPRVLAEGGAQLPAELYAAAKRAGDSERVLETEFGGSISVEGLTWLRVLLPVKGETRGILDLYRTAPAGFSADQQRFFSILGQQVGVALANAQLFGEIRKSREQLQSLSMRLVEVQERERRDIASELHDEVGQLLTGLKMNLEVARVMPSENLQEQLDEALIRVNQLLNQVRSLSLNLRPPMLDDLGLLPALLWQIQRYESQTAIQVEFKHSEIEGRYTTEQETALYRIVQEALTNVARHSSVKHVAVRLWATQNTLGVQIEDEGKGFDPPTVLRSGNTSGLSGMRERMMLLGGTLTIESVVDGGTCITAEFPLERGIGRNHRGTDE
ncbi:MAG: PAS domain S-box protein [Acidobacteriota bacterium]